VLLSGGGSALLPAPAEGISLSDKQSVTRMLMHSGASIQELNCVRKQLSRIKGGRLAAATNAGVIISLIISDVIGDPLDVIASGPTVPDPSTPQEALAVLRTYDPTRVKVPDAVWACLEKNAAQSRESPFPEGRVWNHIIGNNQVALTAAASRAKELGYEVRSLGSENADDAQSVGRDLAKLARELSSEGSTSPQCVLSGGEPVVHLVPTDLPRKGGRNQEVALAALVELWEEGLENIVVLSGGTDGEDGPTDAAGALIDAEVKASAMYRHLDPKAFLAINNSYPFFEQTGGLLKTGPTHTNVMDLRVVLVGKD
jgi:glycerate-2-kinase